MDFFDEALNKAKEAFDIARNKTTEVVHTGKQRLDIASIENKRSKDYETLGRIYFNSIKDSEIEDDEIRALVEDIKLKTQKITELREEINAAQNKRTCPNCGALVENISLYCNICGERMEK